MSLAPLVALVLAAICGLPLLITRDRPAISLLIAIVSFALLAWATRALHLDGLADTADALGSGKPAAAALEIARKSDIGPFGVITLIFTLLLQIAAVASLPDAHDAYFAFVIAIVTSRVALTWACTRMWPAARPDGLGAVVAATVPLLVAIAWTISTIALAWIFVGIAGGVSVVLGILAGIVLLVIARRRLGGMTGDVLGATIEMTATTALLVLALIA
jgi:adenosylcobinamide-GDP ribazoletransferase